MMIFIKIALKTVLLSLLLTFTVLLVWAFDSRNMPALQLWHTVILENEITAEALSQKSTLRDYIELEERLFTELKEKIHDQVELTPELTYSRYLANGKQSPVWGKQNWNRTFELIPEDIKGGVLLLHGLTESPYSLRRVANLFYEKGFYVLGLRLPGHGTIPAALTQVSWADWVAASRLGARHVHSQIGPSSPFVIAGYSNGGGLAIKYALDAMIDSDLPSPERLLLFSPEVEISKAAQIANSHKILSFLPYFEKSKWLEIKPEYDPFKYNSFPKNAAQEAWNVTAAIKKQIKEVRASGDIKNLPAILTFLSWTDSTVDTAATIQNFYAHFENKNSELIIFDVNRLSHLAPFIPNINESLVQHLRTSDELPYRLTVITNEMHDSRQVEQRSKAAQSSVVETRPLQLTWPENVYSLSHVAITYAPDDPVYGDGQTAQDVYGGLSLGALKPRGETNFLTVDLSQFMRLRYNPFYAYVEKRIAGEIDHLLQ